ncbi:MAG: homoserine dehydrogenase [Chloroflexota bacterium]
MKRLNLVVLGIGGVGRSLLQQIVVNRSLHTKQYQLNLSVQAVCDRSGAISAEDRSAGLGDDTLGQVVEFKASGKGLVEHSQGIAQDDPTKIVKQAIADQAANQETVVVDCTATEATVSALTLAIDMGQKVALANKIPLTVQQEVYSRLTTAGATERDLGRSRWETTVGAGLPVIATLGRLIASGDAIQRIAGTFSGTLGYVMTGLQEGKLLSEIVREAYDLGYTEPDPRDDLGGIDVARKALILARGIGWALEMDDVQVEGLYPSSMDALSISEFMDALPELDSSFQQRIQDAAAQGKVLRYAATVEDGQCRVMPTVVHADSPLGRLTGTDNLAEFHTTWYSPNPLVVQGRGAGVEATAAGVLSDIVELAYT